MLVVYLAGMKNYVIDLMLLYALLDHCLDIEGEFSLDLSTA
jgi:hypothetical protein